MHNSPLTLLVVEDNIGDFVLVQEYLSESFSLATVLHAASLKEAFQVLKEKPADVILLDLSLPDSDGISSFNEISSRAKQIPIIVLTGIGDTDLALETVKLGAQDYIVKNDMTPPLLSKSIQYSIERRKIFEHLKTSQEQYKYLFYNNPLPMFAFSQVTYKFLMVNEAAKNHYGYTEEEFLAMTIKDIRPLAEREKLESLLPKYRRENKKIKYLNNWIHQKKSGELIDVDLVTHNIVVEEEDAVLVVVHDITEQKKAKTQLAENEKMLRTISENFPNGAVGILNNDLRYVYTAGKEFHVPDVGSEYFNNTLFTDHFPDPVNKIVQQNLDKVFEGETAVFETSFEGKSFLISAVPLAESTSATKNIVVAFQNVTTQKEEEQQLRLLESVVTNTTDAVIIAKASVEGNGHPILYVNKAFTGMTGYSAEEVIGKTAHILRGPETDDREIQKLIDAEKNGDGCEVEVLNYKKDGTKFWCHFTVLPVTNNNGECTHWISVQRDVSMRKRNESEKEILIEELTQTNTDLRQFSYITSHNLRAPLSNLLGIIQLLDLSTITDPMNSLLIKNFKDSTLQLNETVNDLINVLIIKNNLHAKKEKLNIEAVFDKVRRSVQNLIEQFDVEIQTSFSEVPELEINTTYFESILLNLLTNAIKYRSNKRQAVLNIYTRKFADTIKLYFTDNGLGIDLDRYKDRIFGLYQRFHDHSDSKGLGLYIINSQIRAMGGTIEVESKVDEGTTFIITFKKTEAE